MGALTLVIDSVSAACSVALIGADGGVLAARHERVGRGHAERLVPMIAEVLGEGAGGRIPDAILVDCGPGSFTGLRVGLAAAQGLGIGWGVPVAGYGALSLIAAMTPRTGSEAVAVAVEGGHGELFVQVFAGDPIAPVDALRSLPPGEAARALSASATVVAGSGAARLVAALDGGIQAVDILPEAAAAFRLPADLRALPPRPIYGRAPDAKAAAPKAGAS